MKLFATLAALATISYTVSALPSVTRQGRYLYSNGARFSIKGIAYQEQGDVTTDDASGFPEPTNYVDPLADAAACNRDLPYLKQLGINTVRVYSVNSALNHDACMSALSGAGIYVILDLALPVNGSIDRASPAWTTNLLDLYLGTIDTFSKYDNMLAYNIGNEVVSGQAVSDTTAAPFIKAAARDVKAYLKSKGSTALVSYGSTDGDASWRMALANYLACESEATSIDLYGLNVYRWCGDAGISTYSGLISDYQNYPLPSYFAEFGCVRQGVQRTFTEVAALFGDAQMTNEWSGGVAFSYFAAFGGFGMVTISSDGRTVTTSEDFNRLQQQYSQVTLTTVPAQANAGTNQVAVCPASNANFLASSVLPPTPIKTACNCLQQNGLSCAFSNTASNNTAPIIGELLNYACSQLGTIGGTCLPIGGSGASGVYGAFSTCDPALKLSYALSQYYELTQRQAESCSFGGNATVVTTGPANVAAASAAVSSCAAQAPTGVVTPTAPAVTAKNTQGASGGGGGSNNGNGAGNIQAGGLLAIVIMGVLSGAAVLVV